MPPIQHSIAIWPLVFAVVIMPRPAAGETPVRFNRDVRPILSERCYACHGPGTQEAGFRLDDRESSTEWVIVPGDVDESVLLERITTDDPDLRMPPPASKKPAVTAAEAELIRQWIAEGAEHQPHWSYAAAERATPPAVEHADWPVNPIDRFVLSQLESESLAPSREADLRTLVRRTYLDITGLPPTPDEMREALGDREPGAHQRLVDQLLASPRHAERLAVWWFDLVRFANTVGYHGDQDHRILPYRDYVLKSFNENLAFDQFTIEQLAGDLLPNPTMWQRVATGYNRLLQTSHEGGIQAGEYYAKMQADRVRNVSEVWLGSSMGCSECHDHKFDPFPQKDFYQLAAFFADVDHHGSFERIGKNSLPTNRPPEMLAWTLPVYEKLEQLDQRIGEVERRLEGDVPPSYNELQQKLLELKRQRLELEAQFVPTMVTVATKPRDIRVLPRGDWLDNSGEVVEPAIPDLWRDQLPGSGDGRLTRLDLARWLVSRDNPLTARVVMNRVWALYFGNGLSRQLIDVGSQGEWPTHPELLDWLAVEFMESGWDLRHMERLIVTSRAYRQSSIPSAELAKRDPENRLLARQSRWRLEAESIRDTALQAAGLLVHQLGGDFSKPYQPVGYYAPLNFPEREYRASEGSRQYRRGVYTHWQRQFLHPWLVAFDAPTREECTAGRARSNTPLASLVLLNDPTYVEAARNLATRTMASESDDEARIDFLWQQATSRQPRADETAALQSLVDRHRDHYREHTEDAELLLSVGQSTPPADADIAELAAWTSVCRAVLNLNETITRN